MYPPTHNLTNSFTHIPYITNISPVPPSLLFTPTGSRGLTYAELLDAAVDKEYGCGGDQMVEITSGKVIKKYANPDSTLHG